MIDNFIRTSSPLSTSDQIPISDFNSKSLNLYPEKALRTLLFIISFLFFAHIFAAVFREIFPQEIRFNTLLEKFFDLNNESNFPTFFSAFQLLTASLILFFIASFKSTAQARRNKKFWYFLGAVFLFLALDEATLIHEELVLSIRSRIPDLPGILYYAWVIPYTILVLGVAGYLFKFLFSLPAPTRNLFILAGITFVIGAIGLEIVEGYVEKYYTRENFTYFALITIEELMEMISIAVFIYALLKYLSPLRLKLFVND